MGDYYITAINRRVGEDFRNNLDTITIEYKEKIYFIQNVTDAEKTHIVNSFILSADRDKTKLINKEALSSNSFGVKENKYQ